MDRMNDEHAWFYFICPDNHATSLRLHDFIRTPTVQPAPHPCLYCGQLVDDSIESGLYVGLIPLWTPTLDEPP